MKQEYRVKNWSEYNEGLKQRGSLTFWIIDEVMEQWIEEEKTGNLVSRLIRKLEPATRIELATY